MWNKKFLLAFLYAAWMTTWLQECTSLTQVPSFLYCTMCTKIGRGINSIAALTHIKWRFWELFFGWRREGEKKKGLELFLFLTPSQPHLYRVHFEKSSSSPLPHFLSSFSFQNSSSPPTFNFWRRNPQLISTFPPKKIGSTKVTKSRKYRAKKRIFFKFSFTVMQPFWYTVPH